MNNTLEAGFDKFTVEIQKAMENHYGDEYIVNIKEVNKNNGLLIHGLTVMKKSEMVCPTIYLESFYERYNEGESLSDIVMEIIEILRVSDEYKPEGLDFFNEYEQVKSRLIIKLINKKFNEKLLENIPYRDFCDLAIVCMVEVDMPGGQTGSVLIHNNHICMWGVHEKQLIDDAISNSFAKGNAVIRRMEDMISSIYHSMNDGVEEISEEQIEDMKNCPGGLYVLTNEKQLYGAASIVYKEVRNRLSEQMGGDFYIIPSSVHELIIVPNDIGSSLMNLNEMINEVNSTMVSKDEILSNHAYLYDSGKDLLIPASEVVAFQINSLD